MGVCKIHNAFSVTVSVKTAEKIISWILSLGRLCPLNFDEKIDDNKYHLGKLPGGCDIYACDEMKDDEFICRLCESDKNLSDVRFTIDFKYNKPLKCLCFTKEEMALISINS